MIKRLSALLLVLLLFANTLSGCGKKQTDPQTPTDQTTDDTPAVQETPEEETNPDVIGLAWQSDAELHPYTSTSVTNQTIISLMYESLFLVTSTFETQALLCTECAVSESGYLWYFGIRDDVKFSDGTKLTSEDVVASLQAGVATQFS